jgi:autotransporter-associated beta strand protein
MTGGQTLGLGSISGGNASSQIILLGAATSKNADRVNIISPNCTIAVPTTISDTGAGVAGYVATATGAVISGNVTNNSTATTDIGATSGNDLTVNAIITGSASVLFAAGNSGGAGMVTLSQQNSYTGPTTVNANNSGVIKLGIANALPTSTDFTWQTNGCIFDLNGFDQTIGSLQSTNSAGFITNSASGSGTNTLTISGSTTPPNSFGQKITDNGIRVIAITRSGTGSTILSGNNTFSGSITITGGSLGFNGDSAFGAVPNSFTPGAIVIDGGKLTIETKNGNGQIYTNNPNRGIELGSTAGTAISVISGGALTYNGIIADKPGSTGTLVKQGSGALILGGTNTYSGNTFINNGTVQLTAPNSLPIGTTLNIGQTNSVNLGTFDFNGNNQQIAGLDSGSGTNSTTAQNNITNSSLTAATLTISGSGINSYGDGSTTNSGIIVGPINLVMNGSGTQILGDTNTYIGTTTVSNGTLLVNGDITTSDVNVNGGTLGGSGTIANLVSVQSGGTLAPGVGTNMAGTILTIGNLTLNAGGTTVMQISHNSETNDQIVNTSGTLTYGGALTVITNAGDSPFVAGDSFKLFNSPGVYGGSFSATNLPALGAGLAWSNSFVIDGKLSVISISAPPPVTYLGINSFNLSGTNLTINGTNQGAGMLYVLASTNVATPRTNWIAIATNTLGGSGNFTLAATNVINLNAAQEFYILSTTNNH